MSYSMCICIAIYVYVYVCIRRPLVGHQAVNRMFSSLQQESVQSGKLSSLQVSLSNIASL